MDKRKKRVSEWARKKKKWHHDIYFFEACERCVNCSQFMGVACALLLESYTLFFLLRSPWMLPGYLPYLFMGFHSGRRIYFDGLLNTLQYLHPDPDRVGMYLFRTVRACRSGNGTHIFIYVSIYLSVYVSTCLPICMCGCLTSHLLFLIYT